MADLNLLLRGGVVVLLLLIGAGLLREAPRAQVARLGAFYVLGAAAYTVCSMKGFHGLAGPWAAPVLALNVGANLVFWLFARALFGDEVRLRPWHAGLWLVIAGLGTAAGLGAFAGAPALDRAVGLALCLQALTFAGLATAQTVGSWRADLVEPRRRVRVFIVAASAAHIAMTAILGLWPRVDGATWFRVADAFALTAIVLVVASALMRVSAGGLFGVGDGGKAQPSTTAALDPGEALLLRRLERHMATDRAYRQDGLSIGRLAHTLGAPEYRLRRVINQGLGQRNFAAYLNGLRIAEACAALDDPAQDAAPILTIALDAGFGSLGPFNRAFKAETGMTPTEYRRARAGLSEPIALGDAA